MSVRVNVYEDENCPYYFATFGDDPRPAGGGFFPNAELTECEAAEWQRVRAEHEAWQQKLRGMFLEWQRSQRKR